MVVPSAWVAPVSVFNAALDWLLGRSGEPSSTYSVRVYRLNFVDENDRIHHTCEVCAENDERALCEAEWRRTSLKMELWCGPRLVRKWDWLPIAPPFP